MKLNYLSILFFFTGFAVNAQLYVSPNSYVYVNDQYVYATGNVELKAATSNVYLRNSSQLLQGVSGAGNNKGDGALSVFQEGTVNNYQYNYWCSPVGIPVGASTVNDSFGIVNLGRPTSVTATTFTAPLSMGAVDGISSPLAIAPRWIYKFLSSTTYSQWFSVGTAATIAPGEGFTMKGTSGTDGTTITNEAGTNNPGSQQRYDFRGKPNDGNITVAVANGKFTLVGNPYPSAIDINMVLGKDGPGPDALWGTADDIGSTNNPDINGTAYFWEQVVVNSHLIGSYQGGYGKYTPGGGYLRSDIWSYNPDGTQNLDLNPDGGASNQDGTAFARRFSPVGQGFMVMGVAAGNVTMKNKFRTFVKEGGTSQFAKSSNNKSQAIEFYPAIPNVAGTDYTIQKIGYAPQLRINAIVNNNQGFIRTALGFADGYTNGFDNAADAQATSDTAPFNFYHILEGSNKEYAMSFSPFNINKKCPVGFRNDIPATFKIKVVGTLYGFDDSQRVYLHDKTTNLYHDIKNAEYEVSLPAGVNNDRFEITFVDQSLHANEDIAGNFNIFENNSANSLTIKNPNLIELESCTLYDISGKTIFTKNNLGNETNYEFNTSGLSEGVYIVKLITETKQEVTKKVSIFNKK